MMELGVSSLSLRLRHKLSTPYDHRDIHSLRILKEGRSNGSLQAMCAGDVGEPLRKRSKTKSVASYPLMLFWRLREPNETHAVQGGTI